MPDLTGTRIDIRLGLDRDCALAITLTDSKTLHLNVLHNLAPIAAIGRKERLVNCH